MYGVRLCFFNLHLGQGSIWPRMITENTPRKISLGNSDWILAQHSKAVVTLERQSVLLQSLGLNQLQIATKGYRIFIQAADLS